MSDNDSGGSGSKKAIFCGSGAVVVSLITIGVLYIVAWMFSIGIMWHYYWGMLFIVLIAMQIVFMFVLKKLALIIQPVTVVLVFLVAFLLWYLGTSQVFVAYKLDALDKGQLEKWKPQRVVYIIFEQDAKMGDQKAEKETKDKSKYKAEIKSKIQAMKEEIKTKTKSEKMEFYTTIDLQIENDKDVIAAFEAIKSYWFSSEFFRGFVVIKGKGLSDFVAASKDTSIMKKDDFDKIYEAQTGKALAISDAKKEQ